MWFNEARVRRPEIRMLLIIGVRVDIEMLGAAVRASSKVLVAWLLIPLLPLG